MNIILLSGGSGTRLWPLSNDIRSKQFIKIFRNDKNEYESMIQRIYRQIKEIHPDAEITIATAKKQVSTIRNQLQLEQSICAEPARKDTFPAIALAGSYLKYEKNISENETIIICPIDSYVEKEYFKMFSDIEEKVDEGTSNLTLLGVTPSYPSEKYGYIIPSNDSKSSYVKGFKEKPSAQLAKAYIEGGALWNCGVFGLKLGYLLKVAHDKLDFEDYEDLYQKYETVQSISFDYEVVEKEKSIQVVRFSGIWKDIGTWNTFTEEMVDPIIGNAILDETCTNTNIINELNIPVIGMGLKDMIVTVSGDGILVTDKIQSSFIKPFVKKLIGQAHYVEKSWGSFQVLDIQPKEMTIKIILQPGHGLHYHSHENRDEVWIVIAGEGYIILDGKKSIVKVGDIFSMPVGCKHTIYANTTLHVIEIQIGDNIDVNDKKKYNEYDFRNI